MATVSNSTENAPKYWQNGQYLTAQKDSKGFFYIDENGQRVDLNKPLLTFSFAEQTKNFIKKREDENSILETAITSYQKTAEEIKTNLGNYLASIGIKVGEKDRLNSFQRSKVHDFEYQISQTNHSINRAEMTIRGNLLSNFMDCCSLMKFGNYA